MRHFTLFILMLSLTFSVLGQKIKYKDLYPLLDVQDYENALPNLKTFLANPKNADHANAHLQMATITELRAKALKPLVQAELINSAVDSAVRFFEIAKSLIDEKEIKKNDDYYQSYNRRDLRTGEFGIKVSDVHLDIEQRIQALEKLKEDKTTLNTLLEQVEAKYSDLKNIFSDLSEFHREENLLILRANEEIFATLDDLIDGTIDVRSDIYAIEGLVNDLPTKPFEFKLEEKLIRDFANDGRESPASIHGDFVLWDYESWAKKIKRIVDVDLAPARELTAGYDEDLMNIQKTISEHGEINLEDFSWEVAPKVVKVLTQFEPEPYPIYIFQMHLQETSLKYLMSEYYFPELLDSLDINFQYERADTVVKALEAYEETILDLLVREKFSPEEKYRDYFERRFKGKSNYIKQLAARRDWHAALRESWEEKLAFWYDKANWVVSIQGADTLTIPTFPDTSASYIDFAEVGFLCLNTQLGKNDSLMSIGIEYKEPAKREKHSKVLGYLAKISNPRELIWKTNFSLDGLQIGTNIHDLSGEIVYYDSIYSISYVYAPNEDSTQVNLAVKKIEQDKVKWHQEFVCKSDLFEVVYDPYTLRTSIYYWEDEESTEKKKLAQLTNKGEIFGTNE